MYKTILVPLDGSKRAEAILPHVEELAERYDAKVIFLHVVEPIPPVVGPEGMPVVLYEQGSEQRSRQAASYLEGVQDRFREKGISAEASTVYGPVVEGIIHAAEQEAVDLIALASHGRSGLSQVFYGSVAAGVLHRVNRPLLLIRSRAGE